MTADKHIDYCREMVAQDDRERYECALFAPKNVQPSLWALYAFNQEVAKTRENVSEPALGEIRLQWWRDAIDELRNGKAREHPVVQAMAVTVSSSRVYSLLEALINARQQDLYDEGPADQPALEAYAKAVGGGLSVAALELSLESKPDEGLMEAARAAGSVWAMLGLVRAIPFHWASNRNYVPGDKGRASIATTDADKMFELAQAPIADMIAFSQRQLESLAGLQNAIPDAGRHVFLSNSLAKLYLAALNVAGNNPFKAQYPGSLRRLTTLLWTLLKGPR